MFGDLHRIVKMISPNDGRTIADCHTGFDFLFFSTRGVLFYDTCMIFTFSTRSIGSAAASASPVLQRFGKIRTPNSALSSRNYRGLLQVFQCSAAANLLYISYIYKFGVVGIVSTVFVFDFCPVLSVGNVLLRSLVANPKRRRRSAPNGKSGFPFWQTTKICLQLQQDSLQSIGCWDWDGDGDASFSALEKPRLGTFSAERQTPNAS